MKKTVIIALLCLFFSGCNLLPKVNIVSSKNPVTTEKTKVKETCSGETKFDEYGRLIYCGKKYYSYEQNFDQKEVKITLGQKIDRLFGNSLYLAVFILIGACFVFGPVSVIMWLKARLKKEGKALRQIVHGVQKAKQNGQNYLEEISKAQDKESYKIVNEIKGEFK